MFDNFFKGFSKALGNIAARILIILVIFAAFLLAVQCGING